MNIKRFASILTVSSGLLFVYHLGLLIFDYPNLSGGEGWGVIAVLATLFWLAIILTVGIVIRAFVKSNRLKWMIESAILLMVILIIFQGY